MIGIGLIQIISDHQATKGISTSHIRSEKLSVCHTPTGIDDLPLVTQALTGLLVVPVNSRDHYD